jgi:hypothetical protein
MSAGEDDRHLRPKGAQFVEGLLAAHPRHGQIEDDTSDLVAVLTEKLDGLRAIEAETRAPLRIHGTAHRHASRRRVEPLGMPSIDTIEW